MVASLLPLLWLPPLPLEVPPEFRGTFASDASACSNPDRGMRLTLTKDRLALRARDSRILELVRTSGETLVVLAESAMPPPEPVAQRERADFVPVAPEPTPPPRPLPQIFVLSLAGPDQLRLQDGSSEGPVHMTSGSVLTRCDETHAADQ